MIDRESQWFSLNFVKSATVRSTYCRLVRSSSAFFRSSLGKKSTSFAAPVLIPWNPTNQIKRMRVFFCVVHTGTKIHGETVGSKSTWPKMWGFHDPSFSHNDSERLVRCLKKNKPGLLWVLPVDFLAMNLKRWIFYSVLFMMQQWVDMN